MLRDLNITFSNKGRQYLISNKLIFIHIFWPFVKQYYGEYKGPGVA